MSVPEITKKSLMGRMLGIATVSLLGIFFVVMFANVILRFGFNSGSVILQDLQAYSFGALVLLAIPFAFLADKHVRAELFKPAVTGKYFNVPVLIALVVAPFGVIFLYSVPEVVSAWSVLEGSTEPGGMGGYFLIKTVLPITCLFMIAIAVRRLCGRR